MLVSPPLPTILVVDGLASAVVQLSVVDCPASIALGLTDRLVIAGCWPMWTVKDAVVGSGGDAAVQLCSVTVP